MASPRLSRRAVLLGAAAVGIAAAGPPRARVAAKTPVAGPALADLRQRLRGTLMLPGDSGYGPASAPANARYADTLPLAVARVADEADVVACVAWCAANGVSPVARGGGHSYAGYSTTTGLLLDLRRLNRVDIDRAAGTMTTGGAATNADLFAALENGPHFLPGGICPTVGIGGLTLGGGIGYNTRWAGLTCDHLQHARIVTAQADPLAISASEHPDLFWACRGGAGGSFGVNTAFTFDLVEIPRQPVTNFALHWRGADAAALVLDAFGRILHAAPPEFGATVAIIPTDNDRPRRGIDTYLTGHFIGAKADLRDLLAEALAVKTPPESAVIEEASFWSSMRQLIEPLSPPHAFTDISRYGAAPLPAGTTAEIVDLLVDCPSRTPEAHGLFVLMGWVGGVLTQTARDATAYVHRDMTMLHRPGAVWMPETPASVANELIAWTEAVDATIARHAAAESYQNFPNRGIRDWHAQYYAENFPRLVAVKAAYDPGDLFRNPQSIPVSADA